MDKKYVFAKLSSFDCIGVRLGGAGLGNILFPWARMIVFAKKHNLPIINTTWKSLKIGPLLRGEFDIRGYSNLFVEDNVRGIKKFFLLIFGKKLPEEYKDEALSQENTIPDIIIFYGMKNQMKDIIDDYKIVKKELVKMVTKSNLKNIEKFSGRGISIHVRMGDFYIPRLEDEIRKGTTNCRLPLKWYISIIKKIREAVGKKVEVNIFSDGTDEELKEILGLSNVTRRYYGSAIADMLALAKSDVLITSNSTFSLWASYLGRMPTIWFPGTHRIKLYNINELNTFEIELDYIDIIQKPYSDILKNILKK